MGKQSPRASAKRAHPPIPPVFMVNDDQTVVIHKGRGYFAVDAFNKTNCLGCDFMVSGKCRKPDGLQCTAATRPDSRHVRFCEVKHGETLEARCFALAMELNRFTTLQSHLVSFYTKPGTERRAELKKLAGARGGRNG